MPPLNTTQRVALAIAGAAILLFQAIKIADDGIEGVGWVLAISVGAALLLPVLQLAGRRSPHNGQTTLPSSTNEDTAPRTPTSTARLVDRATRSAAKLHRQLPILIDFPAFQSAEFKQIASAMQSSWKLHCIAFCGSLSLMAEWKHNSKFVVGAPFREAIFALVLPMIEADKEALAAMGALAEFDENNSRENCLRDIRESNKAMMLFARRLFAGHPNADAEFLGHFADKLNVPPPIREGFYENMRRFTKATLGEYLDEA